MRATFGPDDASVKHLMNTGYEAWVDEQLEIPVQKKLLNRTIEIAMMAEPNTQWFSDTGFNTEHSNNLWFYQNSAWWEQALTADDQLRQRVAFALSEIFVISSSSEGFLKRRAEAMAVWYDLLSNHAFGNFRDLMSAATYSPAMGIFLTYQGNRKANPAKGSAPDENYARELMQLFTIGLYKTNANGEPILNSKGERIPTYTQQDVMELARVFTGWDIVGNERYGQRDRKNGNLMVPMEFTAEQHDFGSKTLLGQTIPADLNDGKDTEAALDILFSQPEVAPYISHLLIQRLVTSAPSPAYVGRVAAVFNNNGQGVKGDLAATVRAILLDKEAIASLAKPSDEFVKIKEPILMMTQFLRAIGAEPAAPFPTPNNGLMKNVFWVKSLNIGQVPLQAPSVFNYFESDYSPPEIRGDQPAPEAQILTSNTFVGFSNLLGFIFADCEQQSINLKPVKVRDDIRKRSWNSPIGIQMDITQYQTALKKQGVEPLIRKISEDFLTVPLEETTQQALRNTLKAAAKTEHPRSQQQLLSDAIRLAATSPENWIAR